MSIGTMRVVVIGGGLSGLAAAYAVVRQANRDLPRLLLPVEGVRENRRVATKDAYLDVLRVVRTVEAVPPNDAFTATVDEADTADAIEVVVVDRCTAVALPIDASLLEAKMVVVAILNEGAVV